MTTPLRNRRPLPSTTTSSPTDLETNNPPPPTISKPQPHPWTRLTTSLPTPLKPPLQVLATALSISLLTSLLQTAFVEPVGLIWGVLGPLSAYHDIYSHSSRSYGSSKVLRTTLGLAVLGGWCWVLCWACLRWVGLRGVEGGRGNGGGGSTSSRRGKVVMKRWVRWVWMYAVPFVVGVGYWGVVGRVGWRVVWG